MNLAAPVRKIDAEPYIHAKCPDCGEFDNLLEFRAHGWIYVVHPACQSMMTYDAEEEDADD